MMQRLVDHVWILLTVLLATYSQVVIKWQMNEIGILPIALGPKFLAVAGALTRPWVLSALLATFLSGMCWMVALTRFDLTYAFPFTAISFIVMFAIGTLVFGEAFSAAKLLGTCLVVVGLLLIVVTSPVKS